LGDYLRFLFLVTFLIFSQFTYAFVFNKSELRNSSYGKLSKIRNIYINLLFGLERERPIFNRVVDDKVTSSFSDFFDIDAYARAGETCFYAGWPSEIDGIECRKPKGKSCQSGGVSCNPVLFGDTCILVSSRYENLTSKCERNSKRDPFDSRSDLSSEDFLQLQREVVNFCGKNKKKLASCNKFIDELVKIKDAHDVATGLGSYRGIIDLIDDLNKESFEGQCQKYENKTICPQVLTESLEDIYHNGTVGAVNVIDQNVRKAFNYLSGDDSVVSDFRDPRASCNGIENLDANLEEIDSALKIAYPSYPILDEIAGDCVNDITVKSSIESGRKNKDVALAKSYMKIDYAKKKEQIEGAYFNLVEGQMQIAQMLGEKMSSCSLIQVESAKKYCDEVSACGSRQGDAAFSVKLEEVVQVFEQVRFLERYLTSEELNDDEKIQVKEQIENIINVNPLLKGDFLRKLRDKYTANDKEVPIAIMKDGLISQLKDSSKKIKDKFKQLSKADLCLSGQSSNCDDFNKTMKSISFNKNDVGYPFNKDLSSAMNFYSCIENQKENRDVANEVLDDVAIGVALSFTPMVAVNAIKLSAMAARVARTGASVTKSISNTNKVVLAGDVSYSGIDAGLHFSSCKKAEEDIRGYSGKRINSCEDISLRLVSTSNTSRCASQAAISMALIGLPVASIPAFRFAKGKIKARTISNIEKPTDVDFDFIPESTNPVSRSRVDSIKAPSNSKYVDVSDDVDRDLFLIEKGFNTSEISAINRAKFFRGDQASQMQVDYLAKAGIDGRTVLALQEKGALAVKDSRYLSLTTQDRIRNTSIRPNSVVSVLDGGENLVNGVIVKLEGNFALVKTWSNGFEGIVTVAKDKLFNPILAKRSVLVQDELGGYKELVIETTNMNFVKIEGYAQPLPLSSLKIKPNLTRTKIGRKDFKYAEDDTVLKLQEDLGEIRDFFRNNKDVEAPAELVLKNNEMINESRALLNNQGVETTVLKDEIGALSLRIDGVREGGNPIAEVYIRAQKRFNSLKLTVSPIDTAKRGARGFNSTNSSRTEIGPEALIDLLSGKKNTTALHELRHQMYNSNRMASKASIYDTRIISKGDDATTDLYGRTKARLKKDDRLAYDNSMSLEEIYTHASDSWNLSKGLRNKNSFEAGEILLKLGEKSARLADLSKNSREMFKSVLKSLRNDSDYLIKQEYTMGGPALLKDEFGRVLALKVPPGVSAKLKILDDENFAIKNINKEDIEYLRKVAANFVPETKAKLENLLGYIEKNGRIVTSEDLKLFYENLDKFKYRESYNYLIKMTKERYAREFVLPAFQSTGNSVYRSFGEIQAFAVSLNDKVREAKRLIDSGDYPEELLGEIEVLSTKVGRLVRGK